MLEIKYDEKQQLFMLSNGSISYILGIEKNRYLRHAYFGKYIKSYNGSNAPLFYDRGFCSNPVESDRTFSLDTLLAEYPDFNQGDFRNPAYIIQTKDGKRVSRFYYSGFSIIDGKEKLAGLPSVYAENTDEAKTLRIVLKDTIMQASIYLYYTILAKYDVVCRHAEIVNQGEADIYIDRLMSFSLDFAGCDYDVMTLSGAHLNEKNINRRALCSDSIVMESIRGTSSPQATPFVALMEKDANEDRGNVWAANFIYSGDFQASVQVGQYKTTRMQIGMNSTTFGWHLSSGEKFVSPESVLVYSDKGLNGMSQIFHGLYRHQLCRGKYKEALRPVLLNSWEAYQFDVDEAKCLNLARQAKELGIELFVLDDGWFKNRCADTQGLGDWLEDREKFPHGLKSLAEKLNNEGIAFGIWFEPEMVSAGSELYRNHPDWIIRSQNYKPILSRYQYVLDLSNPQVCQYVIDRLSDILHSVNVSYVKWDMNRHLTDLGSAYLDDKQQKELSHRYVLGLYYIMETLTQNFPNVLFESCSSGGGRYDAGMLHYMPQTWASDNTDAVCRLKIQYGTSMLFPPITMGSHVSIVPNHQVGRITSLNMRFAVAMAGNLGYELDLNKLDEAEKAEIKRQISWYKNIREITQKGTFYRMESPFERNTVSWCFVSEDETKIVCCYYQILAEPIYTNPVLKLKGLKENALYRLNGQDKIFSGSELMYAGLTVPKIEGDFYSEIYILQRI